MLKKVIGDRVNPILLETVEQTLENALECSDSTNQDEIPINQLKEPEIMVNPLHTDLEINQATECPFIFGKCYTQQELKILFNTEYGSDIINWIERKKGTKNPIAQKYSRYFTAKGSGKDKIYVFNGE